MGAVFYHRTSIGEARQILKRGFADTEWDFGLRDARTGDEVIVTGVWLADRPLGDQEGPPGDALLEIAMELDEPDLRPFELEGLLSEARLWVVPAETVNQHGHARLVRVDPRSSWGYGRVDGEEPGEPLP
jgi:hypothetical protein